MSWPHSWNTGTASYSLWEFSCSFVCFKQKKHHMSDILPQHITAIQFDILIHPLSENAKIQPFHTAKLHPHKVMPTSRFILCLCTTQATSYVISIFSAPWHRLLNFSNMYTRYAYLKKSTDNQCAYALYLHLLIIYYIWALLTSSFSVLIDKKNYILSRFKH